jgi:hypothetical protein
VPYNVSLWRHSQQAPTWSIPYLRTKYCPQRLPRKKIDYDQFLKPPYLSIIHVLSSLFSHNHDHPRFCNHLGNEAPLFCSISEEARVREDVIAAADEADQVDQEEAM